MIRPSATARGDGGVSDGAKLDIFDLAASERAPRVEPFLLSPVE